LEFDAIQGPKPYRKAYLENTPILEWGTNLTGLRN
jgi:hypothetical protein